MIDLPDQPPDLIGQSGRAWRYDLAGIHRNAVALGGSPPPPELSVSAWAVHAPWSHPIWPCVAVMCVSLRDIPGFPPATISLPGATHEVMVYALDPDHRIVLDQKPKLLRPVNFAGQFIAANDDEARSRIDQAVYDICAGKLNPDSDGRHAWAARFSRSNIKPGFDDPHHMALTSSGELMVVGMGGQNVRALQQIVETSATLSADESKPQ